MHASVEPRENEEVRCDTVPVATRGLTTTWSVHDRICAHFLQSANLEVAARRIIFNKNINSGQVCIAPNHVMVHHKVRVFIRCGALALC